MKKVFSGRRYLQTKYDVTIEDLPGSFYDYWVVSRGLCAFRTADLSSVPVNKRQSALTNQIPILSPFECPGFYVEWSDGLAQIWLWDEAIRQSFETDHEVNPDTLVVLPEPALIEKGENPGFVAFRGADSHFIQFWSKGSLSAEAGWQGKPTDAEIERFVRGLGVHSLPVLTFRDVEFREHSQADVARLMRRFERPIYFSFATILLLTIGFQLGGIAGSTYRAAALNSEIEELKAEKKPVLELRERVNDMDSTNRRLASLRSQSQTEMGAVMANALAEDQGNLTEWDYKSGQLEVVIVSPKLDHQQYAEKLEPLTEFSSVSLEYESRNDRLKISLEVPDAN